MFRKKSFRLIIIVILLLILSSSTGFYTIYLTYTIKPDAEMINKLGIIRGSIQRLVKNEIGGIRSDNIITMIDSNINAFNNKKIKIFDREGKINSSLDALDESWIELKELIYVYRENPSDQSKMNLLKKSEDIWNVANSMVYVSQIVSEGKIDNYNFSFVFFGINLILVIIIIFLIKTYVQDTLEYSVDYDGLTEIYNRRYFNEALNREIQKSERYNSNLSLIMFDIDHFKKVNDTYGHAVGDSVIMKLANLVKSNIRKSDILARIGGEEFAIIASETSADNAFVLAEKIRKIVQKHRFKHAGKITISLGVTQYILGDSIDTIYKRADVAMYKAKEGGRNRSEVEMGKSMC